MKRRRFLETLTAALLAVTMITGGFAPAAPPEGKGKHLLRERRELPRRRSDCPVSLLRPPQARPFIDPMSLSTQATCFTTVAWRNGIKLIHAGHTVGS